MITSRRYFHDKEPFDSRVNKILGDWGIGGKEVHPYLLRITKAGEDRVRLFLRCHAHACQRAAVMHVTRQALQVVLADTIREVEAFLRQATDLLILMIHPSDSGLCNPVFTPKEAHVAADIHATEGKLVFPSLTLSTSAEAAALAREAEKKTLALALKRLAEREEKERLEREKSRLEALAQAELNVARRGFLWALVNKPTLPKHAMAHVLILIDDEADDADTP